MQSARGERLARWWLQRTPRRLDALINATLAAVFFGLALAADELRTAAFTGVMGCFLALNALLAFERRQYARIIERLEAELARRDAAGPSS